MSWMTDVTEIFTYYTERTQGSSVENKRCSVTWHYRNADPDYGYVEVNKKYPDTHVYNQILDTHLLICIHIQRIPSQRIAKSFRRCHTHEISGRNSSWQEESGSKTNTG